jgi:hypothetical protein
MTTDVVCHSAPLRFARAGLLLVLACLTLGCGSDQVETGDAVHLSDEYPELESHVMEEWTTITQGSFLSLSIGVSKEEAITSLRRMGAATLLPDLRKPAEASHADQLLELNGAAALIIGAGDATIVFSDDEVVEINVAPIFPAWRRLLDGARTREDVRAALKTILENFPSIIVREFAPDSRHVYIDSIGTGERDLLNKYDLWSVSIDSKDGYLHMRLEFHQGLLSRISVLDMPGPL